MNILIAVAVQLAVTIAVSVAQVWVLDRFGVEITAPTRARKIIGIALDNSLGFIIAWFLFFNLMPALALR